MVHYSKIVSGLVQFIDQDMVSKMHGSWKAWAVGTAAALIARRAEAMFRDISNNQYIHALGLIDGEMVDVEGIYSALLQQAQKGSATVDMPLIGSVTYSAADVEQLYRCIMG